MDKVSRYKGICPVCGAVLWISPSIAMAAEWNYSGHGTCFACSSFLHLEFDPLKKEFISHLWEDYIADIASNDDEKPNN